MKVSFNERTDAIERQIKDKRRKSKQKNSTGENRSNTRQQAAQQN